MPPTPNANLVYVVQLIGGPEDGLHLYVPVAWLHPLVEKRELRMTIEIGRHVYSALAGSPFRFQHIHVHMEEGTCMTCRKTPVPPVRWRPLQ